MSSPAERLWVVVVEFCYGVESVIYGGKRVFFDRTGALLITPSVRPRRGPTPSSVPHASTRQITCASLLLPLLTRSNCSLPYLSQEDSWSSLKAILMNRLGKNCVRHKTDLKKKNLDHSFIAILCMCAWHSFYKPNVYPAIKQKWQTRLCGSVLWKYNHRVCIVLLTLGKSADMRLVDISRIPSSCTGCKA